MKRNLTLALAILTLSLGTIANSADIPGWYGEKATVESLKAMGISFNVHRIDGFPSPIGVLLPRQIVEGELTNVFSEIRLVSDDIDVTIDSQASSIGRAASFRISEQMAKKTRLCIAYKFTTEGVWPGVEYYVDINQIMTKAGAVSEKDKK